MLVLLFFFYQFAIFTPSLLEEVERSIIMITLTIFIILLLTVGTAILAVGGGLLVVFLDPIICGLLLYGIVKLIKLIRK